MMPEYSLRSNAEEWEKYTFLRGAFFLSLLLLPINGFPLGRHNELMLELGFYPFLLISPLLMLLLLEKYYRHSFVSKIMLLFIYWNVVSGMANLDNILNAYYKQTAGLIRYSSQLFIVIIGYMLILLISTVIVKYKITLEQLAKYILGSLYLCVVVGIIEMLGKIAGVNVFLEVYSSIATATNRGKFIPDRIHTLSGEPSWYGIYGSFAYPFLLYTVVKHRKHVLLLVLFLVTIYFTQSRTMYFIVLLQSLCFLPLLMRNHILNGKNVGIALVTLALLAGTAYLNKEAASRVMQQLTDTLHSINDFSLESNESYSSITRLGMQATAVNMGLAHPIFGVGQGQYMFHFQNFVPSWALESYEIQDALNPLRSKFPQTHGMYARIGAELGLSGLLIWLVLWGTCIVKVYRMKNRVEPERRGEVYMLLCLSLGVLACGFNVESFRMMVVWMTLGILAGWHIREQETIQNKKGFPENE